MDFTDEEIISMFGGIKPMPAAAHETQHNSLLRQINEIPAQEEEPITDEQQHVTRK